MDMASVDEVYLFELFPPEVWVAIFANVSDNSTYLKISAASSPLQNLIYQQRQQILFPDVIQHLYKYLYNNNPRSRADKLRYACTELMDCRLVCRAWRKGINHIFQNLPDHYTFEKEQQQLDYHRSVERYYTNFDLRPGSDSVSEFSSHFESTEHLTYGLNPFLFRAINVNCLSLGSTNPRAPFYSEFVQLLQRLGHHVWYCKMYLEDYRMEMELSFLDKLKEILRLLPNLRVIWIDGNLPGHLSSDKLLQLQQHTTVNPPPILPYLQNVHSHGLPSPMNDQLFYTNSQVTLLDVKHASNCQACGSEVPWQLRYLTNLRVTLDNEEHFNEFEGSCAIWPDLTKLNVNLQSLRTLQWDRIFRFLEAKFEKSVVEMGLSLPISASEKYCGQLKLANIRILDLKLQTFVCLDFLLTAKENLEEFSLYVSAVGPNGGTFQELVLKFYKHIYHKEELHLSNVWKYFQKLKIVTIKGTGYTTQVQSCTREKWENYQRSLD